MHVNLYIIKYFNPNLGELVPAQQARLAKLVIQEITNKIQQKEVMIESQKGRIYILLNRYRILGYIYGT